MEFEIEIRKLLAVQKMFGIGPVIPNVIPRGAHLIDEEIEALDAAVLRELLKELRDEYDRKCKVVLQYQGLKK